MATDPLDYWVSSSVCSPVLFADDGLEDGSLDYWVSASICSPEPVLASAGVSYIDVSLSISSAGVVNSFISNLKKYLLNLTSVSIIGCDGYRDRSVNVDIDNILGCNTFVGKITPVYFDGIDSGTDLTIAVYTIAVVGYDISIDESSNVMFTSVDRIRSIPTNFNIDSDVDVVVGRDRCIAIIVDGSSDLISSIILGGFVTYNFDISASSDISLNVYRDRIYSVNVVDSSTQITGVSLDRSINVDLDENISIGPNLNRIRCILFDASCNSGIISSVILGGIVIYNVDISIGSSVAGFINRDRTYNLNIVDSSTQITGVGLDRSIDVGVDESVVVGPNLSRVRGVVSVVESDSGLSASVSLGLLVLLGIDIDASSDVISTGSRIVGLYNVDFTSGFDFDVDISRDRSVAYNINSVSSLLSTLSFIKQYVVDITGISTLVVNLAGRQILIGTSISGDSSLYSTILVSTIVLVNLDILYINMDERFTNYINMDERFTNYINMDERFTNYIN